ncbi:MAG: redoxin domain-containing protein [Saprospiraceae bacterium]|nr:redoxin domain-containing protein [Saprospiraceae bacterium]
MSLLLTLAISWLSLNAPSEPAITVYIFMSEDCVICQSYSLELKRLHETYASEQIEFLGVFPNFSSKPAAIDAFRQKYHVPFELKTDYFRTLTDQLEASVTPEVVVWEHASQTALYRGRIDNTFYRVGKRRRVTTTSELEDALRAIQAGQEVTVSETEVVGCFISQKKF